MNSNINNEIKDRRIYGLYLLHSTVFINIIQDTFLRSYKGFSWLNKVVVNIIVGIVTGYNNETYNIAKFLSRSIFKLTCF